MQIITGIRLCSVVVQTIHSDRDKHRPNFQFSFSGLVFLATVMWLGLFCGVEADTTKLAHQCTFLTCNRNHSQLSTTKQLEVQFLTTNNQQDFPVFWLLTPCFTGQIAMMTVKFGNFHHHPRMGEVWVPKNYKDTTNFRIWMPDRAYALRNSYKIFEINSMMVFSFAWSS